MILVFMISKGDDKNIAANSAIINPQYARIILTLWTSAWNINFEDS